MEVYEMLGLEVPEQLIQFTIDMVECLRKPLASDELKDQFVKNLMYLVNQLLTSTDPNVKRHLKLDRVYSKVSYIGRKLMLDIKTSTDRLETIVCFFKISVDLLQHLYPDPEKEASSPDNVLRKTVEQVLNLT